MCACACACTVSAWCLLTDERMPHHIKKCTDAEGKRQLGDDTWSISIHEIEAFVSLLYGRGAEGTGSYRWLRD